MIISEVSQDLDSLSDRLSTIFSSFQSRSEKGVGGPESFERPHYQYSGTTDYYQQQQQPGERAPYNFQDRDVKPRPYSESKAIQCDDLPASKLGYSDEARRAVQEYKNRKMGGEEEGVQTNYYQESRREMPSKRQYENEQSPTPVDDRERRYQPASDPRETTQKAKPRNPNELIENYYSNLLKKSNYETSQSRNIHDLYKNKPRQGTFCSLIQTSDDKT